MTDHLHRPSRLHRRAAEHRGKLGASWPDDRYSRAADGSIDATIDTTGGRMVRRLLESFFRRPIVCLLPLVLLSVFGVSSVAGAEKRFVSSGVLSVSSETLLSNLTNVRVPDGFSWESPASLTSRHINELMGTDEFTRVVGDGAGLGGAMDTGVIELPDIRRSIGSFPIGANLVRVVAATDDPELSLRLADSTLETFVEWVIAGDVSQSTTAETFFASLLTSYEADVQAARAALDDYLAEHPVPESGGRPANERATISRLTAQADLAEERYLSAVQSSQDAHLATEQTRVDVSQRLRVVDQPERAVSPESSRKDQVLSMAMFVIAGLLFSAGLVVFGALIDRSIRSVSDVRTRLGHDVIAVVPDARG